ncbi:UPF0758 protein [Clostridia bacterium]|nr:UPF0758 protein [Clostridia bacterium]
MTIIKEMPAMERPREKLQLLGAGNLSNAELLAVLLSTGTRELSAVALADMIISIDGSGISYLTECSLEELSGIKGVGIAKACRIAAAVELGKRIATGPGKKKITITSGRDLADIFMPDMRFLKNECFKALLLNIKNEVIAIHPITVGIINSSIVDPREVFRAAIKRGAASLVLAHNHPSGNPEPSGADVDVTIRLVEAGKLLGVTVIDHIVIGDGVYVSMKQRQLI